MGEDDIGNITARLHIDKLSSWQRKLCEKISNGKEIV